MTPNPEPRVALSNEPAASAPRATPPSPAPGAHLVRLLAIVVVGVTGALFARAELVPDTFGREGHYRAAALDEAAAQDPLYLGSTTCAECHAKQVGVHAKGKHKGVACETCHGPANGHLTTAKTRVPMQVVKSEALCFTCHRKVAGRPEKFPQIDLDEHRAKREFDKDAKCVDCHESHKPD